MSNAPGLVSYNEFASSFKASPLNPAEIHGFICGLLCATGGKMLPGWEKKLMGNKGSQKSLSTLHDTTDVSYRQITEFSFEFALLLPDDDTDINVRAECLGFWCQGFLMGLKFASVPIDHRSPSVMTDTINDIIEIAKVSSGDMVDNEEDETAYFELVEYVRLAVLLVFHEMNQRGPSNNPNKALH